MNHRYKIVNVTKKQYFIPMKDHTIEGILWAGDKNIALLYNLLKGEWKGDEVVIAGDHHRLIHCDEVGSYVLNEVELDEHFTELNMKDMREKYKLINTWKEVQKGFYINYTTKEFINLSYSPKGLYGVVSPIALMIIAKINATDEYKGVNKLICGHWEEGKVGITLDFQETKGMSEIKPMFEIWR